MYPEFDIKSKYITIHPCDLLPSYLSTIQDRARARRESPNEKTVRSRTKKGEIQTIRQQEYPNFFDFFFPALPWLLSFAMRVSHFYLAWPDWLPPYFFPLSLLWCWTFISGSWKCVLFSAAVSKKKISVFIISGNKLYRMKEDEGPFTHSRTTSTPDPGKFLPLPPPFGQQRRRILSTIPEPGVQKDDWRTRAPTIFYSRENSPKVRKPKPFDFSMADE